MGATSQHFSESELSCHGTNCCGRQNECKPELLDALELLRSVIGKPIVVTSGYRCPAHNIAVGGAKNSQHVLGIAADIRVVGMTARDIEAHARMVPAIKGIGRDDFGNFVHVDTRPTPAQWCYDRSGKTITYYAPAAQST